MRSSREALLARLVALQTKMKTRPAKPDTAEIQDLLQRCADMLNSTSSWAENELTAGKEAAAAALATHKKPLFPKQTIVDTCALLVDCFQYKIDETAMAKIRAGEIAKNQARLEAAEKARVEVDAERARAEAERLKAAEEKAQLAAAAKAEALRASEERVQQETARVAAAEETRKQAELQKAATKATFLASITTGIAALKTEYRKHGGSQSKSEVQFNLTGVNTKDTEAMTAAFIAIIKRLRTADAGGASSKTLPNAEKLAGELGIALPARAAVSPQGKNASSFLPWKKPATREVAAAVQPASTGTPVPH